MSSKKPYTHWEQFVVIWWQQTIENNYSEKSAAEVGGTCDKLFSASREQLRWLPMRVKNTVD